MLIVKCKGNLLFVCLTTKRGSKKEKILHIQGEDHFREFEAKIRWKAGSPGGKCPRLGHRGAQLLTYFPLIAVNLG